MKWKFLRLEIYSDRSAAFWYLDKLKCFDVWCWNSNDVERVELSGLKWDFSESHVSYERSLRYMILVVCFTAWTVAVIVCSQVDTFSISLSLSNYFTIFHVERWNRAKKRIQWYEGATDSRNRLKFSGEMMHVNRIYHKTSSQKKKKGILVSNTSKGMKEGDSRRADTECFFSWEQISVQMSMKDHLRLFSFT